MAPPRSHSSLASPSRTPASQAATYALFAASLTAVALAIFAYNNHQGNNRDDNDNLLEDENSNLLKDDNEGKKSLDESTKATSRSLTEKSNNEGDVGKDAEETVVDDHPNANDCDPVDSDDVFTFRPIGTVRSIYRLCVGTPRQGMLAPHSRGQIVFDSSLLSSDSIVELEKYSHIWVVFIFHLNTNTNVVHRNNHSSSSSSTTINIDAKQGTRGKKQFPSKIAPPALGGKRVGLFSTRTPHRPNPIGFTLCRLDSVYTPVKGKSIKKNANYAVNDNFYLNVSGLDLVDGTPVLDVKPYVPHYDSVQLRHQHEQQSIMAPIDIIKIDHSQIDKDDDADSITNERIQIASDAPNGAIVPDWVSSGLGRRRSVTLASQADLQLKAIVDSDGLEFYGKQSAWGDNNDNAFQSIRQCIIEVLGADVRSAWQTGKARTGKFQAERAGRIREVLTSPDAENITDSTNIKKKKEDNSDSVISGNNALETMEETWCTQQIDNLLIKYSANAPDGQSSADPVTKGSGAQDSVLVHVIERMVKLQDSPSDDATALDGTIISENEENNEADDTSNKTENTDDGATAKQSNIEKSLDVEKATHTQGECEAVDREDNKEMTSLDEDQPFEFIETSEANDASNVESPIKNVSSSTNKMDGHVMPINVVDNVYRNEEEATTTSDLTPAEQFREDSITPDDEATSLSEETRGTGTDESFDSETHSYAGRPPGRRKIRIPQAAPIREPSPALRSKPVGFSALKTYWSAAATINTPSGINPRDADRRASMLRVHDSQKFFAFSARPIKYTNFDEGSSVSESGSRAEDAPTAVKNDTLENTVVSKTERLDEEEEEEEEEGAAMKENPKAEEVENGPSQVDTTRAVHGQEIDNKNVEAPNTLVESTTDDTNNQNTSTSGNQLKAISGNTPSQSGETDISSAEVVSKPDTGKTNPSPEIKDIVNENPEISNASVVATPMDN